MRGQIAIPVFLLVMAGLLSLLLTFLGVFGAAWGGLGTPLTFMFWVWALPVLSIPTLTLYFFAPKTAMAIAWIAAFGDWICISSANWMDCVSGQCSTRNPFVVLLGSAVVGPVPFMLILAVLISAAAKLQRLNKLEKESIATNV